MPDTPTTPIGTFTLHEVNQMVERQANALFATLGTHGHLAVIGRLASLPENPRYGSYYGAILQDPDGPDSLFLDIPEALAPEPLQGKVIEVHGAVAGKVQGAKGLRVALRVVRLQPLTGALLSEGEGMEEASLRTILGKANSEGVCK